MRHSSFMRSGPLVAISLLVASCTGARNLGEDLGSGGISVGSGGSSMANGGSSAADGGSSMAIVDSTNGGAMGTGGSSGTGGMASTGGNPGTGGTSTDTGSTGGSSTGTGGSSPVPYVIDPTLPIDSACTCETSDKICNAARECVPRCDDAGHCARWLAPGPVEDMFVEGDTLFYLVAAGRDVLGNPTPNGSGALYRVDTAGGTPTLVNSTPSNPRKILGRYNGVTYILADDQTGSAIYSVTEAQGLNLGAVDYDAVMWGHWIAYASRDKTALMGIDLSSGTSPVVLAQPAEWTRRQPILLDDFVVYTAGTQRCSLRLSDISKAPECAQVSTTSSDAASSGTRYYLSIRDSVLSFEPPATQLLRVYTDVDGLGFNPYKISYAAGWLYIDLYSMASSKSRLVRVPTSVGRVSQQVIPEDIVTRHNDSGKGTTLAMIFAVDATQVFWVQSPAEPQPQYIFSSPLPPQPCDTELPCADASHVCTDGFCGPA